VGETPNRIVLVGFMGSGKSAVGARLAGRLGYRFEDMDRRIERRTRRSIAVIFEERGEEAFREEELREATALARLDRRVIAAGGGAFTRPETRARLQEGAITVWIRGDLDTLLRRIRPDGTRPLAGNRAIMRALLAEREPSYRLADLVVDTTRDTTPGGVAGRIADLIDQRRGEEKAAER
jgi:shikimate kinase/3-dehydroquinate synthase